MGSILGLCIGSDKNQKKHQNEEQQKVRQKNEVSEQDRIVIQLKNMRDQLTIQKKKLYIQEEQAEKEVKQMLREKKQEKAKFALQRKKLYEKYVQNVENKYTFLQNQIMEVEKVQMDKNLSDVIAQTNNLLSDIQKSIDMEKHLDDYKENVANIEQRQQQFQDLFDQYNDQREVDDAYNVYEAQIFKEQVDVVDNNMNQQQFQPVVNQQSYQQQQQQSNVNQQQQEENQRQLELLN